MTRGEAWLEVGHDKRWGLTSGRARPEVGLD